jgi:hypothetical protein
LGFDGFDFEFSAKPSHISKVSGSDQETRHSFDEKNGADPHSFVVKKLNATLYDGLRNSEKQILVAS